MTTYSSPGVYIQEISVIPPSIAQVPSAVPAFIGYTQTADLLNAGDNLLHNVPQQISSMADYESYFGVAATEDHTSFTIGVVEQQSGGVTTGYIPTITVDPTKMSRHILHDSVQFYFDNGGTSCYIVSAGLYTDNTTPQLPDLKTALAALANVVGPTIILCPEAVFLYPQPAPPPTPSGNPASTDFDAFNSAMLDQAASLMDRFAILDTPLPAKTNGTSVLTDVNETIYNVAPELSTGLQYGAVYYPWLTTLYNYNINFDTLTISTYTIQVISPAPAGVTPPQSPTAPCSMATIKNTFNTLYNYLNNYITSNFFQNLPPSPAIAGIYCSVDGSRGVWKAPANVPVQNVSQPYTVISKADQGTLNVNPFTGKSVNAIVTMPGYGTLVYGARTLDGNDNEWRYINVRRTFITIEQSVKNAIRNFVFEPNVSNTWTKVQSMIESFLYLQWRGGALAGAKPELAYIVQVGLGTTMTSDDILNGRMVVTVQLAVSRPAEFIIMQFEQMQQTS